MKKHIRPDYYDEFKCIADKCSFTCCQEWNIAVDQNTLREWKDIKFQGKNLETYTKTKQGVKAISLTQNHQCPFLNENKLCKLVMEHGDAILSDTCTTFPRQIHEYKDRIESSVVSCCPEVVDILHRQDRIRLIDSQENSYASVISDGEQSVGSNDSDRKATLQEMRDCFMNIVQNPIVDLNMEMMILFQIVLEIFSCRGATIHELNVCQSDTYLKKMAEEINQMEFDPIGTFEENNELFLDLVENYRKEGLYTRHLKGTVELAERLENSANEQDLKQLEKFNVAMKEYDLLFRNYLAAELFTNALVPDCNLESFVVMVQWISLEYVSMRHFIYLKWMLSNKETTEQNQHETILYTDVRDGIVLISRITGYDQEDIVEYLDNSFQSRIWDWGYLALIIGKRG